MKIKSRMIMCSLLLGIVWTIVPFLIGRISFLEDLANIMAWPGSVAADALLRRSIHDTIWVIPVAIAANVFIAAGIVYINTWFFYFLIRKKD
jgi:hypothetical protein